MPGRTPGKRTPGEAPAARRALRDADEAWPRRRGGVEHGDGIMGDAAHQARPSDHNLGNAVDIAHDPASGADGAIMARLALDDPRVTYVIFNRRIWNRQAPWRDDPDGPGRPYSGAPHTHHVHISIREDMREDDRPWPWSPHFDPYA